ncbi:RHS repeat-associated core domain-containing protein, partial [Pseudomonas putida]|uniref:RHS repeat-associated core domain-containing protein n=2 Tax=Pseudomonas TaxID=286 RepID=UPI002117CAA8
VQYFEYDAEQRLVCVEQYRSGERERVVFAYDPLGRRISKEVYQREYPEPRRRVLFHWQGLRLLQEVQSGYSSLYVYASMDSYDPLARIDGKSESDEIHYFHTTLVGQPEQLTDSDGNTIWRSDHHGWGKITNEWHSQQNGREQNLRNQGQYIDRETGLHFNTFRFYDPDIGRFTKTDPLGIEGGVNLYSYAPNIVNYTDPLGLCPENVKEYDITPYRPSNSPLENHHGILDIWAAQNVPSYGGKYPKGSPTIVLSSKNHAATKAVYREWLREKTGKPVGGKVDWSQISNREVMKLSERMFDVAGVPATSRSAYYRALNRYLHTGTF